MSDWSAERVKTILEQYVPDSAHLDAQGRRRRRLVESGSALFAQHGYRRTSVDDIARHAGVSKATFYAYFKNKGELVFHAIGLEKKRAFEQILPMLQPDLAPRERVKRWFREVRALMQRMPMTSRLIRGDRELAHVLAEMPADEMVRVEKLRFDFFADWLRALAAPRTLTGEQLEDRVQLLGGLFYFAVLSDDPQIHGTLSPDRFLQVLADVVGDGLVPPPPAAGEGVPEGEAR